MTKSTQNQWNKIGINLALSFIKADTAYLTTKRDLLLNTVIKHGDADKLKAILAGYRETWLANGYNENVAKVRASEANTVFKAVLATQVTNDNLNKLQAYNGSYNEFIKFARNLLPAKHAKTSSKASNKLSDKAFAKLDDTLSRLSSDQVKATVTKASNHLYSIGQDANITGLQQFVLINNIANSILNHADKFDAFTLKYADEFSKMSNLAIEHIQGTLAQATQAINNAMDSTPYDTVQEVAPKQQKATPKQQSNKASNKATKKQTTLAKAA